MGYINENKREDEVLKRISELRLLDDALATAALDGNLKAMQEILRTVTQNSHMTVTFAKAQKTVTNLKGRGARFDLLAIDSKRNAYDLEIQRTASGASPQRARYNSSLMDALMLDSGEIQTKIKKSFMIFFMENDFFGKGLPLYHVERCVKETGDAFGDGNTIIYVNGEYRNERTKVGRLVHDFRQTEPDMMYSTVLADAVRTYKNDENGKEKLMGVMEELEKKAYDEGVRRSKMEILANMLEIGVDVSTMAKILKVSERKLKRMIDELDR